jgi:hypothetical protein
LPDLAVYPIVDPRGLVTPLYDGWSLDFWIISDRGKRLLPSKLAEEAVRQKLEMDSGARRGHVLPLRGARTRTPDFPLCRWMPSSAEVRIEVDANASEDAWLAVAVRPYNPEGVAVHPSH